MSIERLNWDSQFLGLEVGRTNRDKLLTVSNNEIDKYDLLYLMENEIIADDAFLPYRNNLLVDCKLIYSKQNLNLSLSTDYRIKDYNKYEDTRVRREQLYSLAYLSGEHSRYKLDANFAKGKFEEMYRMWVDNSISGEMADHLFYIEEEGKICAFVTLKIIHEEGVIGLIATDKNVQAKGMGKTLMLKCEETLRLKGIDRLNVATQASNNIACLFYEKCEMRVTEMTFIYHSWKC